MNTTTASFLHISDLHFGQGGAAGSSSEDREYVLQRLLYDADNFLNRHSWSLDFAVVTGDIAFSGGLLSNEYEVARGFLEDLSTRLQVPTSSIYVVPGNHDIDRSLSNERDVARLLAALRQRTIPGERIDDALAHDADRERLLARLSRYIELGRLFGNGAAKEPNGLEGIYWSMLVSGRTGARIGLAGLNSAVLALDDDDYKRLQIGQRQLNEAAELFQTSDLRIALLHHPFDWLADGTQARERLRASGVQIVCFGHLHVPRAVSEQPGGRAQLIELAAGAAWEGGNGSWSSSGGYGYSLNQLRNGRGGWVLLHAPRRYDTTRQEFVTDTTWVPQGESWAEFRVGGGDLRGETGSAVQADLRDVSERMLLAFGNLRTAHPTDLSLRQLHEQGLFVSCALTGEDGTEYRIENLSGAIGDSGPVAIIGEPGSGKTFALYEYALSLRNAGHSVLLATASRLARDTELQRLVRAGSIPGSVDYVLVDALDEVRVEDLSDLVNLLESIAASTRLVVSARKTAFVNDLSFRLRDSISIGMLLSTNIWRVDVEFREYLDKMRGRLSIDVDRLVHAASRPPLSHLAERPLHARMLVYVADEVGFSDLDPNIIAGEVSLYDRYLLALATRTRADLRARGCEDVDPYEAWVELSARLWAEDSIRGESFPAAVWLGVLSDAGEHSPLCANDALPLASYQVQYGTQTYVLGHYSFFEFLLAIGARNELMAPSSSRLRHIIGRDLTREVRHYLVDISRSGADQPLLDRLVGYFDAFNDSPPLVSSLRARNLVVYLISRLWNDSAPVLGRLLVNETDIFLRVSLSWALCHLGDRSGLESFIAGYADERFASMARGYVRYYYGDIDFDAPPPYVDDGPYADHDLLRTDTYLLPRLLDPELAKRVRPERRLVDLLTYLDLKRHRAEQVDSRVGVMMEQALVEAGIEPVEFEAFLMRR